MTDEPPVTRPLLDRLRQGDRDALGDLFAYYRPRLRQMLRLRIDARLAARLDPSDVLQEAYLDAARQVDNYVREPKVTAYIWLRGLARERLANLEQQHLGARRRAVSRDLSLPGQSSLLLAKHLLAPGTGSGEAFLKHGVRQQVQRALARISAEDREVLLMRHFEGMTNGEVAQALSLTDSTATMRYGRALFRLKEVLVAELNARGSPP
jgi:RNA polymerase sigma-70 factor (ECF subfamily)